MLVVLLLLTHEHTCVRMHLTCTGLASGAGPAAAAGGDGPAAPHLCRRGAGPPVLHSRGGAHAAPAAAATWQHQVMLMRAGSVCGGWGEVEATGGGGGLVLGRMVAPIPTLHTTGC
jgi:hypothetical protein